MKPRLENVKKTEDLATPIIENLWTFMKDDAPLRSRLISKMV